MLACTEPITALNEHVPLQKGLRLASPLVEWARQPTSMSMFHYKKD